MAKKMRHQFQYGLKPGDTTISGEFQIAAGLGITVPDTKHGIKSVTRSGTGAYTVNLDDKYLGLSGFSATLEHATSEDGYNVKLAGEWLAGVSTVNEADGIADGYLKLLVVDDESAAADPIGHNVWLTIKAKTSEQG